MKNKQTNRRLLSLLLSLCLMLSLVTPAMATGETAGQETEQTTACPTEIKAVETTLTATKLPEGSTLPKTITLVTPNVINVDKRSQIHMEISGLPAGEQFLLVLGEKILYTSWVNGCYFYDWSYGNSLETGSRSFTVKVQDSQYSEKNTVVYEMSEGESIPIYLATEDEFPVPALAQLTQEREKATAEQLNVQAWLNLPVGTLSEYNKSDLTMKLFDQSGALCGVSRSGQFYERQSSMTDTRYDFFKTDHYYETSYESAYAQVYLGKPLDAGNYTAAVYNGDREIARLENAVTVYDYPLVSASGNSGIAANTVGATTAYIQVGLVGGNPSDFGVKVYTKNGNCIGTSNEYRVEKTSSSDVRVSYIVPLNEALEKDKNYRVEVVSEKAFEYEREPGTLSVSDRALEDVCFASHFYANVVLRSSGFDPQEIYPVQLKGNSGDTVLAETTASPDENGVWEIEFRGTDGQPYPIEANGGYRVVVIAKDEDGGEEKFEQSLYNQNVSQITSSVALMSMAGEGNNEETPTTGETLPLTYQRASINAAVYDGVLQVWLKGLSETNYATLTKKVWQDLFQFRLTDMTGAETLTLSLNTQKSKAFEGSRDFQFYFDASQLPKGCYGSAELFFDGKLVTDANGSGVFAANQYIIQNSGLPYVNPSNVGLSDRAVRYTTSLYAYNVGGEPLTLQLFTAANRTAAADASITLDPGSGYEITADDLSAVNRYLRYSVNAALTSGPVGNASDYIYLAPSAFWNQSNESCTVKVDSSVEHGTLTLLAPEGMTEDGKYPSYTELYVLAEPAEGYRLKANSVRILAGTKSYPLYGRGFPVLEDCTVTAEFEKIPETTYTVTVKAADYEGTAIADKARAAAGETVTITAVPAEGHAAVDMYEHNTYYKYSDANGNTVTKALTKNADGTLSFVMPNVAVEVHVRFRQYGYVRITSSVYGLGSDYDLGNSITATDAAGNPVMEEWSAVKENQDIFLYVPQTMTGTYGTYTLNKAASYLSYNNKETNEEVKVWLSGLMPEEGKEDTYRFTLPYANEVYCYITYYELKSYQVTVDAVANGTLTLDRDGGLYYPGETVTVTAVPASNYYYASAVYARVEETGTDLTVTQNANGTWSFVMPDSAVKVWGTFEYRTPDSKTLTLLVEGETYGSLWDKWEMGGLRGGSTAVGSEVKFKVKVNDGAKLVQLVCIEDGSGAEVMLTCDANGIYSFIMPNSDVTLKAVFAPESTGGEGSEIKDAVGLAAALGGKAELVDSVTVRLTADVTLTEPLRITGGTLKLLLDRYYIYYDNGTEAAIVVDGANADFTIDGVSRSSQDTVERINGIRGESGGALDVRSGKLTVLGGGYYGGVHIGAGASAVIQSGTPASGMMAAYEAEPTIVSGSKTPALHIEKDGTADIRNAYFFFDGDNCIMSLPDGKTLTDYTAGAKILAYIREEDGTLTQIKKDYAKASVITVGVEGYSVTAAPAEGAVWNLKAEALPANVTAAIPITAKFGYTIKNVWYTTAASGGSSSGGSGTVVNSAAGGTTESSTSGGSSSGGSSAGGIWYETHSGRWYMTMPAAPITLHAEVEELPERRFLDRTIFSTRETDWYINLWSSINGYSLDYNTGYVVATLMDEEGNTVLSRQENQESYGYINFVSKDIAEGRYRLYVAVGDANQKIELGYQLITAADSIGYNVGIKRGSLTTETRSFEADAYIHETLTLLPSDLTMQLVRFDTATSGTTDTTASGTTTETVVAESRDYTARYYGGNSTTGSSADKQNGSGYSNLLFTFNLGEARLTAGNYALRLVSETTIFTANGENNFSVTEEPWIDSGSFDVNTLTWTAATENIAAGSYTAHYDDQNGQRVNLSMTVAEDGTAKIVFPAWPFQDQVEQLSYTIWINANLGSVEKGFHVEYMVPNAGGGEDNSEWYPMTVNGMWTVNYTEAGAQIWNAIAYSGSSPVLKVTIPGASGSGWYRLNGGSAGEQWGEISDLSAFTVPMSDVQANYRYDLNVFRERNDSWSIASCSGLGFISIPMLGVDPNNVGWFKGDTLTVYPMNLTDAERSTLKLGYKTADKGYVELSYTLNSDGTVTLNVKDVPYGRYRLLAEYRPDGSAKMETLYVGDWMLQNSTYAVETEGGISVAAFEPKTVNGVTTMEVRYENGTPSADVLMRIYKAESVDGSKEMSLSLVKEINIGKNGYTINSSALGLGGGDYVFYFTTTDGTFLGSQLASFGAAEYTVKFLGLYGKLISSQTVTAGGSVTAPDAPVRDGYTFIGWKDSTGTMVSDFTNITADMTLTAVYEAKQMTVTLFLDGGSFTDTKYQTEYSVQYGEEFVDLPPENALTREGYTFDGWYGDIYYKKQFTSESRICESLILYAKWSAIPVSYAVNFVYDNAVVRDLWSTADTNGLAEAGKKVDFGFAVNAGWLCTELLCVGESGLSYSAKIGGTDDTSEGLHGYKAWFIMPEEPVRLTIVCERFDGAIKVNMNDQNISYVNISGGDPWHSFNQMNGHEELGSNVSFEGLPLGTYYVSGTTTSGYSFEKVVTLTENDPTQTVTIAPEKTYTVTGTLTNVPTGGVWLEVYRENGGCVASQWVDKGFFKFSIPAGTYTLRAFGKQEYPVRIGTGDTAEFTVSEEDNKVITAELVGLPSVKVTISAEQQIGKYAYLLLEQRNGDSWQYISSTICASANGTEVWLEDVIPATGTYRLQLTDLSRGYYSGYESFTSNEVQFDVAEIAETTIGKTLSYSLPAEPVKSLSGSVTVDRTEVYGGELVDLAIRWKSESGDAVQPTFTLTLPSGVTLANSAQTTNLMPEKEATEGIFHVTLRVDKNAAGALRIPVQATLGDETALFGTANLSIAKLMITAPVQVRVGETVTVYGEAAEGELVTIRNADTGTILAVAQAKGRYYSAKLALTGPAALVAETADGTVRSAQIMVKVVNDPIAVTGVTYGAYGEKAAYNERLNAFTFWQYVDLYMMGGDLPVSVSFRGSGIQSVKLSFCGLTQATQSSDGAWTTIFKEGTWGASGLKYLTADVTTADGETLHFVAAVVNLLIDPSGIVTDTNGDPLAGVTVYCQVWKDNQWVNFDAENYGQVNPQVTDESGRYGWMVPEGKYRILAVKEGYQTYDSLNDEMFSLNGGSTIVIPPVRTDINFSMAPDTSKSYTIFPTAVENATIHCDRSNAAAGENVTLKASAASGYMLEAIRVTGVDSGRSYAVSSNSNGSYSFTMPAERVSYSATLAEAPTEVSVTANGDIKVSGLKTQDIKLIAAFYAADGRMIAVTMPPLKVNGTEATAAVQMQNGAKLRVFLLNSETNAPLAQCASLDQTTT